MKVSIITACLNSSETVKDCLNSVKKQSHFDIEHIIIDGGSKDETLDIIKETSDNCLVFSSEDKGIYDALNKGINQASGDIIGILHSDDFFAYSEVINEIVNEFKNKNCDGVYADLDYVDRSEKEKITRSWVSGIYKEGLMQQGWMPPHPTLFLKREVYQKYGTFRLDLSHAADYELMLRFIEKYKITLSYLPSKIVKMRVGGLSNRSIKDRLIANHEDKLAWELNELKPPSFIQLKKPLRKIGQFLKLSS